MTHKEYNEKANKLLKKYKVPVKYREKCKKQAWVLGQPYGYGKCYNYLLEIIEIFDI